MRSLVFFSLLTVTGFLGGCGPKAPVKAPVKGNVSLDGKPLADGEIYFTVPGQPPEILAVKNGAFEGQITVGQKKVEVYAYRDVPPPPSATGEVTPSRMNYIPPQYNNNSKWTLDLTEAGATDLSYKATSR